MSQVQLTQLATQPTTQPTQPTTHPMTQPTNQPTTQPMQPTTQGVQAAPSMIQTQVSGHCTGRQRGSQGYSGEDCMAIVNCVKRILPLGSNDWNHVHELYEQYVVQNNRLLCDPYPIKTKFKAMVALRKPTGNPNCPVWIREAKHANLMIKDRAKTLAFVDNKDEELDSADERNGVGNPVPLLPVDPGSQSQSTLISGWSATQSQLPDNPIDVDDDPNDKSLCKYGNIAQSSGNASMGATQGLTSAATPGGPLGAGPVDRCKAQKCL
ncbi:uncharacterized protein PGTG_04749 [Puccinia graminis f. sp. tritici CRL 75-36-700-3]|uniref:DUF6818 domain-containing protein n=1 Tax=Puccinia graminis f. sp. tritici (strain CRL 75-36-700-3 / race SCCL) TaxID=418459 RepID=E3K3Z1_PUCGT|nr:uncharacterized protein PGTG_04749 [Puccinia graminis f. sp. tritici CRL 75-36-700-3]EFP78793.1 hypothetical protein PGTG_04749 [Puccinia graminis f. sp. tritici CRL 75-36-700-3]